MTIAIETNRVQPDIEYQPNFEKYNARTNRRLETETLSKELPVGFPTKLISPLVWNGSEFQSEDEWTYVLSGEDIEELNQALAHFKSLTTSTSRLIVNADHVAKAI
jgi:hypothetical protein